MTPQQPKKPASDGALRRMVRLLAEEVAHEPDVALSVVIEAFLKSQRHRHRIGKIVASTVSENERQLGFLVESLGSLNVQEGGSYELNVQDVTEELVQRHMEERFEEGRSNGTVRREVQTLVQCMKFGVKRGYFEHNPLTNLELPPVGKAYQKRPRARFTPEELVALISAARAIDRYQLALNPSIEGNRAWIIPQRPLLMAAIWTAARLSELGLTRWDDLNPSRQLLRVWASENKGKRERLFPITGQDVRLLQWLRRRQQRALGREIGGADRIFLSPRGGELDNSNVRRYFDRVLKVAGVRKVNGRGERLVWHSLRHAMGDEVAQLNIRAGQLLLGHADSRTTQHYLHGGGDSQFVREAVEIARQRLRETYLRVTPDLALKCDGEAPERSSPLGDEPGLAAAGVVVETMGLEPTAFALRIQSEETCDGDAGNAEPPSGEDAVSDEAPRSWVGHRIVLEGLPDGEAVYLSSGVALQIVLGVLEELRQALETGPVLLEGASDAE